MMLSQRADWFGDGEVLTALAEHAHK